KAQSLGARWAVVETWDELYEGSEIAETAEWGRFYIRATNTFASAFKRDRPIMLPQACPDIPDVEEAAPAPSPTQVAPAAPSPVPVDQSICPGGGKKKKPKSTPLCP